MRRIRRFDPEPDGQSAPVAWPCAALIAATLFLNFFFWHFDQVWMFFPLPLYAGILAVGALLIAALFFAGPALASCAARRPLFGIVENSLGSIPVFGVRLCCVCFLVLWISGLVALPVSWWLHLILPGVSTAESAAVAAALLAFLFVTGLQSIRTSARLALFTNKLGLAILIAALIRVHEGWPAALRGFPVPAMHSTVSDVEDGLSSLALHVAPLAFLAADFGHRLQARKQVLMTAGLGVALPLCGTLLLVGVIDVATFASHYYRPSGNPTVAMALWSQVAASAMPACWMITAITLFGAARFGVSALANSLSMPALGRRPRWVLLGCLGVFILWCSLHPYAVNFTIPFDVSATCLAVAAAVLSADFVSGRRWDDPVRRIDWVGTAALLAGLATALGVRFGTAHAGDSWLLLSYGVAFVACLLGRASNDRASHRRCRTGLPACLGQAVPLPELREALPGPGWSPRWCHALHIQ